MAKNNRPMPLLDIFVLYLVQHGLTTLYRLKSEAGISIGAASPALRRLEKNELVYRPTKRVRGKQKQIVGDRGQRVYQASVISWGVNQSNWLASFEASLPTDLESVARLVALAVADQKTDVAARVLNKAISERLRRARRGMVPAAGHSIASRYRSIIQTCEAARLKAEASALKKILADLK